MVGVAEEDPGLAAAAVPAMGNPMMTEAFEEVSPAELSTEEQHIEEPEMNLTQDICEDTAALQYIKHKSYPSGLSKTEKTRIRMRAARYEFKDDQLWVKAKGDRPAKCVPAMTERQALVQRYHDVAHFGVDKVFKTLQQTYEWEGMRSLIKEVAKNCHQCARVDSTQNPPRENQPLPVSKRLKRWHIDLVGPLPRSKMGNCYAVVAVDAATKWVEAGAIPNKRSATIRSWTYINIICRFGAPTEMVSDNGKEFSKNFSKMLQPLHIRHRHTSQYHPQANGAVEKVNDVIQKSLTKKAQDDPVDWDLHLPGVLMGIRSSYHSSIKMSPAEALMGTTLMVPEAIRVEDPIQGPSNSEESTNEGSDLDMPAVQQEMQERLRTAEELVQQRNLQAQQLQSKKALAYRKKKAAGKRLQSIPAVNTFVKVRATHVSGKLKKQWETGIFQVVAYNLAQTVATLKTRNGSTWSESVDNIKQFP
jgi:uncharacterized protein YoxC